MIIELILWHSLRAESLSFMTLTGQSRARMSKDADFDGRLAAESVDGTVVITDAASGVVRRKLQGAKDDIACVAISPNDGFVLAGCGRWSDIPSRHSDNSVLIWNLSSGKLERLAGHTRPVTDVYWAGRDVLSVGRDASVHIWDATNGRLLNRIHVSAQSSGIDALGDRLLVRNASGVSVWQVPSGKMVSHLSSIYQGPEERHFDVARIAPTGRVFATAGFKDKFGVRIWDAKDCHPVCSLPGHGDAATDFAFSKDGSKLLVGYLDRTLAIYDSTTGKELTKLLSPGPVESVLMSPDESTCIVKWNTIRADKSTPEEHGAILVRLKDGSQIHLGSEAYSRLVSYSSDGSTFYERQTLGRRAAVFSSWDGQLVRRMGN